jgi:hypothetical protein
MFRQALVAIELFQKTRKSRALRGFLVWWAHTDLNRGPKDYESPTDAPR